MVVGDYVRSSWGTIDKIRKYIPYEDSEEFSIILENKSYGNHYKSKNQFNNDYKSSPNIIDLIQEGDYVNGLRVDVIKNGQLLNANSYDGWLVNIASDSDEIETIVTKEQFKSREYVVKCNKE